jgi:NAD(P)-dependent dehydrogenase (short-subunit alcohol dehydrogenase family)
MGEAMSFRDWEGRALVVGAGGIGGALLAQLPAWAPGLACFGSRRQPAGGSSSPSGWQPLALDLTSDASLQSLVDTFTDGPPLRLVINTAGVLHGQGLQPEKRLSQLSRQALDRSFAVNAFGAVLLARALEPLLPRDRPCHFASLSARVGSIADNRLGGWYAYRAAKAAQNQLLRTLALEWRRRLPLCCVSLLHPGTTATDLSAPFQSGVPPERLFSPDRCARQLLEVLDGLGPDRSGGFWAWDGSVIPW